MLANVPPIVGIYTAFFPVLAYFLLGTSRHNSMGTFAVVSMLVGKTVLRYDEYSAIQIAVTVTFVVGLIQIAMYFLRLGILSSLLSETLVSGFTTGACIHVIASQAKDLIGVEINSGSKNHEVLLVNSPT